MKKMTLSLALLFSLGLSACSHYRHHAHHHGKSCCGGECKMEKKQGCSGECKMDERKSEEQKK